MTHVTQGVLQEYLDGELGPDRLQAVRRHVGACALCAQRLAALETGAAWTATRVGEGEGKAAVADAEAAWERLAAVWGRGAGQQASGPTPLPSRRRSWPIAVGAAAALAVGALALSPVRAAAAQMLQVFRVQNVQVVTVSPSDLASIQKALQGAGKVDVQGLAQVQVQSQGKAQTLPLAAARAAVGFPLAVPGALPAGYTLSGVQVQPQTQVAFSHLQVGAINSLLASLGSRQGLPAAVGLATIDLSMPPSAVLEYAAAGQAPIEVAEGPTPTLSVPAGVDVNAVRQVLLNLPFIPSDLRSQLAAVANWQDTAVIPQVAGVSQAVTVNGAQGTFVASPAKSGSGSVLLWFSGGVVRAIHGNLSLAAAQAIAASMS